MDMQTDKKKDVNLMIYRYLILREMNRGSEGDKYTS